VGGERHLARDIRHAGGSGWTACRGPDRQHAYEGAQLGRRRKRGALVQAIGISRGGHISKLHALTDGEGRPLRFLLTGGNVADCRAADVLLDDLAPRTIVLAHKAYDSNAIRDLIERKGAVPNIPSKRTARKAASRARSTKTKRGGAHVLPPQGLSPRRRVATRYDKLATNLLGAIYLVAAVTW
jgi:transposase